MTKTIRVGVIGAGYWGPNIVRNLYEAPGAEAVAVADLSQERLDAISKRFPSLRVTTDYREVIGDPTIDAICIVTPVGTHRKFAEEAFAAGKHVLVEKPLAQSVSDAEAIVRAQERAGKTLMVGHTFVYNPAVEVVKRILDSDGIGTVYYLDSQRVNLGLHQFDTNVLWDLGPHDVSITLYWLDQEPEWVQCSGASFAQPDIEDVVFLMIGFPSGAIAHAHLSWLAPSKLRRTVVVGSRKMAVYDDTLPAERVKVYDRGVEAISIEELRRSYRAGDVHSPRIPETEPLQLEMRHFVDCINGDALPLSGGEAGTRVVRVLEAGMRSLRTGGARVPYRIEGARRPELVTLASIGA